MNSNDDLARELIVRIVAAALAGRDIAEAVIASEWLADEIAAAEQRGAENERAKREVASIPMDEIGWDDLAEAMGATIKTQGYPSGEYHSIMIWPDGRRAHERDRLVIISTDAELPDVCQRCSGSGQVDSGRMQPDGWGEGQEHVIDSCPDCASSGKRV